ncbi:GNAT family N-acetyltransferase [Glacieibacterium frigidum]|uniref:GNAT family N-acetyltransferase n=1 Tax=Glacieibacterium frigidum TaxID=2593303 RepID=A0A552U7B8_9SPHN|nr:GNAT family N-acetyltransferase [Glacieibacterium frigidum]TRW14114.1 GNAT family N-acetyltransferase [Glacieibacterium frigidum]
MIETERLILAEWRDDHRAPIAAINADPEVMRYFVAPMTRAETDAQVDRQIAAQTEHGFCFWAIERKADGVLMGLAGLKLGAPDTPIARDLEVGWRFGKDFWGHGYASEAARAALAHGFADPAWPRIAAITTTENRASRAVMDRIGMTYAEGLDFDHPAVPRDSPVLRHVTYFIDRP